MKLYEDSEQAELLAKAEAGDAEAQCYLGWLMYEASGNAEEKSADKVEELKREGRKWLSKSAKQGYLEAFGDLAEAFELYEEDYDSAFYWYREAYKKGDRRALAGMAGLYIWGAYSGYGGPEGDLDYGFYLLGRAVREGDDSSLSMDLVSYLEQGVSEDSSNIYIRRMCGSAYALRELLHDRSEILRRKTRKVIDGLSEEEREALHRCWEAIEMEEKKGDFSLHKPILGLSEEEAIMDWRENMIITPEDVTDEYGDFVRNLWCRIVNDQKLTREQGLEVPAWIEMPARDGDARYQYVLGKWYLPGNGYNEEPDMEKARFWLAKAAEQGYKLTET